LNLTRLGVVFAALVQLASAGLMDQMLVRDSLSRVHPRMRASWLRERGLDDSYYTTFRRPESTGLACTGRWPWGPSWELAGRDTFLYLGSGSGVRILSIADSVEPRMLGQINARGLVSGLAVQDTLLFVACGSWGAQIYSVSDPANPRELGSLDAVIGDLCVKDTFCYTLGGDSLTIYNVANPAEPVRMAAIHDSGGLLAAANGYVFSAGAGMNVYDVRVPTAPTWVGSRGGSYLALFVRGTLLFCSGIQPSYFTILDVSNPASMIQLGTVNGYGGEDICVLGHLACLSCVYDHHGLYTIDVTDSMSPSILGNYVPDGAEFFDVYIRPDGLRSYIASWYGGLSVGDISNPSVPREVWFGYQADQAVDVVVDGSRAYVSDMSGGMRILDVSDPDVPTELGLYDVIGNKDVRTATARDSFAFVSRAGSAGRKYLHVLDVLDPSNPTLVAQESCYNPPEDYVLRDSFIYAAEANQFQVFNVARPRQPVLVGSCGGDGVAVVVQDTFAYTAAGAIRVTNIARPDSPFVVSTISGHSGSGLAVRDTFLYIPQAYDTLWVYSVASPSAPRLLGFAPVGTHCWDVALAESLAAVATVQGLVIFSLENPVQPHRRAAITTPYGPRRVVYAAPYFYAAMWEAGVGIYSAESLGLQEQVGPVSRRTQLGMSPNPARDRCRLTLGTADVRQVRLRDVTGRVVPAVGVRVEINRGLLLDLSKLAPGVYFVEVDTDGRISSVKLVKQ
jgi:hypothetical protein